MPHANTLGPAKLGLKQKSTSPILPGQSLRARHGSASPARWTAGLDAGSVTPQLDAIYYTGVVIVAASSSLLFFQTYGGKVGLGKFLSQGPEDKNWERQQSRAALEQNLKMNEEQKGSWLSNLLPDLDFVEVYGKEKAAPSEPVMSPEDQQFVEELQREMMKAVEQQDFGKAEALKQQIQKRIGGEKTDSE
eukprot:CAMPEP_0184296004 /NCGR_PEP_ID=MMETSP1049-20130417/6954_1 /TAXON_ID=77928 /ORGANISM="Proteomonas sulcata, Strain CCMP704" /LENGTH=190 /DNA_ID=CAMNT_0026604945 /DNA_START=285 /DNA_END=857 /DNA_ORIENTATION=+